MSVSTLVQSDGTVEIEKAILGSILMDCEKLAEAIESGLKPQHFHLTVHAKIINVMLLLDTQNKTPDFLSVAGLLQKDNDINKSYLIDLSEAAPITLNIKQHVQTLIEKYKARQIDRCLRSSIDKIGSGATPDEVMEAIEQQFMGLSEQDEEGIVPIDIVVQETMKEIEEAIENQGICKGCSTGFQNLDNYTHGLNPSDLIILAGRPGMGKTAFALNLATNILESGKRVLLFSLEMGRTQLTGRMIANKSRINSQTLRTGNFDDDELDRVYHSCKQLYGYGNKFGLDQTSSISLAKLRMRATRWKKKHGLDCIMIDYLQLMTPSANSKKQSREREIGELSNGLKALAKDLNVPIVLLSQLNRDTAKSTDKEPQLHNLRDSGSIEQDADQILFVHRPGYYDKNIDSSKTEIKIAKNRHGEVGYCNFQFNLGQMRFVESEG